MVGTLRYPPTPPCSVLQGVRGQCHTASWFIYWERTLPRLLISACPRRLRLSPTGAPTANISLEWSCLDSPHGHAHASSGRLLRAQPGGESPGKALSAPSYIGTPTPPLVVSYWCIQLIQLSGGALLVLLTSALPCRLRSSPTSTPSCHIS